jgi:hypothetical protein
VRRRFTPSANCTIIAELLRLFNFALALFPVWQCACKIIVCLCNGKGEVAVTWIIITLIKVGQIENFHKLLIDPLIVDYLTDALGDKDGLQKLAGCSYAVVLRETLWSGIVLIGAKISTNWPKATGF